MNKVDTFSSPIFSVLNQSPHLFSFNALGMLLNVSDLVAANDIRY